MKVLLVYPEFPDTYWSFRHALKFEGKRAPFPPLGLLTVSAMLPGAWERRLVDMNVRRLKDSDIEWADLVFAGSMIVQKESLERVVERCKAKGKRVVVGGPYVSTSAEHLPAADHIFIGETEATLPEFLADLERGEPKPFYQAAERPALKDEWMAQGAEPWVHGQDPPIGRVSARQQGEQYGLGADDDRGRREEH